MMKRRVIAKKSKSKLKVRAAKKCLNRRSARAHDSSLTRVEQKKRIAARRVIMDDDGIIFRDRVAR